MKFILDDTGEGHLIQHYDQGEVTVSGIVYRRNCIVLPDQVIADWRPNIYLDLKREDFSFLAELTPEIVILGTGATQYFPHPGLTEPLIEHRIGLEVMNTASACRTYNILMSEGRHVAAALFMI